MKYYNILLLFFACSFIGKVNAQHFYRVSHTLGTQTISSENITVIPINSPTTAGIGCTTPGVAYAIGRPTNPFNAYEYLFSSPIRFVRLLFSAFDSAEVVTIYLNGNKYFLTPTNLTFNYGYCTNNLQIANGDITRDTNGGNGAITIIATSRFDSIRVQHGSFSGNGTGYEFCFAKDSSAYINPLFTDTVKCAGDSLKLKFAVTTKLRSNNVFTAQLSNASGSFALPVNIGTLATDTAGTVNCVLPANTPNGTGYRVRIVAGAPLDTTEDNGADIKIFQYPAAHAAGSNSPVCAGNAINLTAATSTSGATYSWSGPGSYTSSAQNPGINPSALTDSGNYVATITSNGCAVKDTAHVMVKPVPQNVTAGSNTPVCPGTTLSLTASSSTPGTTWGWSGPAGFSSASQNATRTNMLTAWAGTYMATANLNGCTAAASAGVTVVITTPTPVANSNTPVCAGGNLDLSASSIPGAAYSWTGPAGYNAAIQNPTRSNVQLAHAGSYTVTANIAGCVSLPASTTVSVITGPSVSIYPSPDDTICAGGGVALVSIPFNVGPGATYDWYKNGASTGITTNSYIPATINTGDYFYVLLTAGSACNTPVSSNTVTLTVLPNTPPPVVSISANPATGIWPGLWVGFAGNVANGGTNPGYQWKRNGQKINGATAVNWGAADLQDRDNICLEVTSSDKCASPKTVMSNCIDIQVATGISGQEKENRVALYPNPNKGRFTIIPRPSEEGVLIIYTLQGQEVARYDIREAKTAIELPKSTATGIYMGRYLPERGLDSKSYIVRIVVE